MAFNVEKDRCVGCGCCVETCPNNALSLLNGKAQLDEARCVECGACQACCPCGAINQD